MFSAIKCPGLCCATALLGDFYPHETWIIIQLIQINSVSGITTTGVKYLTDTDLYAIRAKPCLANYFSQDKVMARV